MAAASFSEKSDQQPSDALIEIIATAEGVSPVELDPISESIDLDAVNQLFRSYDDSEHKIVLNFTVDDWKVFVRDDGAIRVCDPDRTTSPAPVFEKSIAD